MGSGHGTLAGFPYALKVDALICGDIGSGAQTALGEAGIMLFGGVKGDSDKAVKSIVIVVVQEKACNHNEKKSFFFI